MCRFHKDVARAVATDPETGEFNVGVYAVALVGMYPRIEEYMPDMFGCDGFVAAEMSGADHQRHLEQSEKLAPYVYNADCSLKTLDDIRIADEIFRTENLGLLREAMSKVAEKHDLSAEGLSFPDHAKLTAEGYKASCCAPPDRRQNGPFLDVAVVHAFTGYDDQKVEIKGDDGVLYREYYTSQPLTIRDDAPASDDPEVKGYDLGPIISATRDYLEMPGVRDVIGEMFAHGVVRIFRSAPHAQELSSEIDWYENSAGCAMCGGKKAATAFNDAVAPTTPSSELSRDLEV